MISRLRGTLLTRDPDAVEVETPGGVIYELDVPTTVFQRLPAQGEPVEIRTVQVVREDSVSLYGFLTSGERELFRRLMTTSGVGAKLALAMLSAYTAPRLAQALVEKDVVALRQVSGVGKKTAERLALELADKMDDLALSREAGPGEGAPGVQEAVAALVALGYGFADADQAVRAALAEGDVESADVLIRRALALKGR
ncbi:MAG TPA: Holliday junction branch migration protein RuvA [Longimicrobiales bacterium]|nr:Holliday junction branch migration protein RuvA [Longimicrobiales bacterium]